MQTKLFEVRDSGTLIPVMATEFNGYESPLFRAGGYGPSRYVILCKLSGGGVGATYDPFGWDQSTRTMQEAHSHIEKHWDTLQDGDVIDVQFILGETAEPKVSQLMIAETLERR